MKRANQKTEHTKTMLDYAQKRIADSDVNEILNAIGHVLPITITCTIDPAAHRRIWSLPACPIRSSSQSAGRCVLPERSLIRENI